MLPQLSVPLFSLPCGVKRWRCCRSCIQSTHRIGSTSGFRRLSRSQRLPKRCARTQLPLHRQRSNESVGGSNQVAALMLGKIHIQCIDIKGGSTDGSQECTVRSDALETTAHRSGFQRLAKVQGARRGKGLGIQPEYRLRWIKDVLKIEIVSIS